MKFISWNVNGLRACVNKGFLESFYQLEADFFCLQETKLQEGQIELELPGYYQYWCYAQKKGYSGTAIFTKHQPLNVAYGLGIEALDTEGRLITLEYQEFYLVTCYTPNAQRELARIEHRLAWESAMLEYLKKLDQLKPVIYCGDLNVAHQEIDLKNPASNRGNAGFSDQERSAFSKLLSSGFTDSFRHLYPDVSGAYSWWSYMFKARQNNAGWRIDYFVVSDRLKGAIADATIHPDIMGSDHCPVGLELDTTCNGSIWSPETNRPQSHSDDKADRNSPVGSVKKSGLIILGILPALLLILSIFLIREWKPVQELPNETTVTVAPLTELIGEIRYPSEPLEVLVVPSVLAAHAPEFYFRIGNEVFQPVAPVADFSIYERMPTFCAIVTFGAECSFSADTLPQVQYRQSLGTVYFYEPYLIHQFFYDHDGSIGGFLLMGDIPKDITSTLTVCYSNKISTETLNITAEHDPQDYEKYTTEALVDALGTNQTLSRLQPYAIIDGEIHFNLVHYDLEYFMTHNQAAAELLTRDDAVDTLFDALNEISVSAFSPYPNILMLLSYDAFQEQMTPEQKEVYQQIEPNQDTPYLPTRGLEDIILFG